LIVVGVDGRIVTSSSNTPRKRRQLESPGVAAEEQSMAAPAKNLSLRDENQKDTAVLVVAHLGIHD
jgi:hypothetical protein